MIAVLICDDHPLFRQGLRRLLETVEEFAVVGEVERAEEVAAAVRKGRPDVVVLDVELPGGSGIGAVEALRAQAPDVRVLMLSGFSDPTRVRATFSRTRRHRRSSIRSAAWPPGAPSSLRSSLKPSPPRCATSRKRSGHAEGSPA